MEVETKLRKWGNSYALLLPRDVVINQNLSENDIVIADIKPKKVDLTGLFGFLKFNKPTKEIMKEIRKGYD